MKAGASHRKVPGEPSARGRSDRKAAWRCRRIGTDIKEKEGGVQRT